MTSWPRTATPVHGFEPKKSADDIRKEKTEALKDLDKAVESARAYQKAKAAKVAKATAGKPPPAAS